MTTKEKLKLPWREIAAIVTIITIFGGGISAYFSLKTSVNILQETRTRMESDIGKLTDKIDEINEVNTKIATITTQQSTISQDINEIKKDLREIRNRLPVVKSASVVFIPKK